MKITLSKKQWESIGQKTGWIKSAQQANLKDQKALFPCKECKGEKYRYYKLKNHGSGEMVDHLLPCNSCNGKGFISQEDIDSYNHSMGVGPCPHGNCGN